MTLKPLPQVIDPEHLTQAFRRWGILGNARIADAAVESSRATILSQITRLRLAYDSGAPDAPRSGILKTGHPDRLSDGWAGGLQEVAFYTQVSSVAPGRFAPRCFEAYGDEESKTWHLLLDDLTDTHVVAASWPSPPTMERCAAIVEALARFHAMWWDDPRLGKSVGAWADTAATTRYLRNLAEKFAQFTNRLGDNLPRERCPLYERLLSAGPRLLERYHTHRNLTIVHGDLHVLNSFLPRDAGDDVRFLDWDSWRIGAESADLAYLIAIHWYPDRRTRLERPLLDRYHATLTSHGVDGCDRHALDHDYRMSVLWHITTPVHQAVYNIPPVWWNNLERVFLAVDDLGCRDLLA
jgi:hypothetical protein